MRINFLGGASEVGASCILLNIDAKNLLFDSGIRMGGSEILPDMSIIQQKGGVDAIFVSHAHMDHSGSLPVISREYPDANIYMTHATKDLIRVLLFDSLKIMENKEAEIPVFAQIHVENMLKKILCFSPGYTFSPFNDDIHVTFYSAGHVVGSVGIYVSGKEGAFFYSGDFSVTPQSSVEGAAFPRLRPDMAVFEATYGDRLHSDRGIEEQRLIEKVREVVISENKILIPAFALGRAQEVILILKKAINKGQLPTFNIYVDGMVKDICRVYKLNPNYLTNWLAKKIFKGNEIFYDDNVIAVTGRQKQREEIISKNEPCCIISSSGMLTGGPSQWYAEKLAQNENNYIALTGYQDEESPGRQLLELIDSEEEDRFLKLGDRTDPIKCGIGKYGLSAHADKTQIISFAHSLGARHLFFIHGNSETVSNLAYEVQKEYRGKVYNPSNGEEYEINVKNPRKQILRENPPTLNKLTKPSCEDIQKIWELLLANDGDKRVYTAEELFYCFCGADDFTEEDILNLQNLLNESSFFEPDRKKPFMFRPLDRQTVEEQKKNEGYMEVNQMLKLVDEYFPEESGLYKKGARFEQKTAVLSFNFPSAAVPKYKDKFREFEDATGWSIEVNSECNLIEAENLISKLLPDDIEMATSVSYFRTDGLFKVKVADKFEDEAVINKFKEITGMRICFEVKGKENAVPNTPPVRQEGQMEQNIALQHIEKAFESKKNKLYKKSLKTNVSESFIELSFISPFVGERYAELIKELEAQTCWDIRINQSPNQNEILKTGKNIFESKGISLKKTLSYLPKEMKVRAITHGIDEPLKKDIQEEFVKVTGIEIEII